MREYNPMALLPQILGAMYWPCYCAVRWAASCGRAMYIAGSIFLNPLEWFVYVSGKWCWWVEHWFDVAALLVFRKSIVLFVDKIYSMSLSYLPVNDEVVKEFTWLVNNTCACMFLVELVAYGEEDTHFTPQGIPYETLYCGLSVAILYFLATDYYTGMALKYEFWRTETQPREPVKQSKDELDLVPVDPAKYTERVASWINKGQWTNETFRCTFEKMAALIAEISEDCGAGQKLVSDTIKQLVSTRS